MEHILYTSGKIVSPGSLGVRRFYGAEHPFGDIAVRGHIAIPDAYIRELQIPFFRAELSIYAPSLSNTEAAASARVLRDSIKNAEWPENLDDHLVNVLSGIDDLYYHFTGSKEELPAIYSMHNYVEQVPNPDSRVSLAPERDALGLNRPAVDWRLSDLDKTGIKKAQDVIAHEVGRSGFGRMRLELPDSENTLLEGADGGAHHMGTTRMHADPRHGVVDENCRIHGLHNLYVAGSSVFPTVGYINPTLTIVALAIRLAEHLEAEIGT